MLRPGELRLQVDNANLSAFSHRETDEVLKVRLASLAFQPVYKKLKPFLAFVRSDQRIICWFGALGTSHSCCFDSCCTSDILATAYTLQMEILARLHVCRSYDTIGVMLHSTFMH